MTVHSPRPTPQAPHAVVFHGHCHQKAASALSPTVKLLERIPGAQVTVLDAGCCGMAGSFGFERAHYDLSMQIGEMRLFPAVRCSTGCLDRRRPAFRAVSRLPMALGGKQNTPSFCCIALVRVESPPNGFRLHE
jgi:hypothetical protein